MPYTPALTLSVNASQLAEAEEYLRGVSGGVNKLLADGINRTLDQSKTHASRLIRERVRIPKRLIDRRIRAMPRAMQFDLRGTLTIEHSKRLSLGDFAPRQTKRGVSFGLSTGKRGFVPGAFLVTLPSRNGPYQQVFKREDGWHHRKPQQRRGHRGKGLSGLKIISLKGVSAWGAFTKGGLLPPTIRYAQDQLAKNIDNRLDRLLFTSKKISLATARAGGGDE